MDFKYTMPTEAAKGHMLMPRWLKKIDLSSDAKVLYIYLLDRYQEAIRKRQRDACGEAYCHYRREEIAEDLGISVRTAQRTVRELEDHRLCQVVQSGGSRPSRIYLADTHVDWHAVELDAKVKVSDDGVNWHNRHFAKYQDGYVYTFPSGHTSWTVKESPQWLMSDETYTPWKYARLERTKHADKKDYK